jgi:hypothetical protein
LAACGGGAKTPQVASLGHSGHGAASSTTTLPKGNATQLLDEWAKCMRSHGDPEQIDPTVDAGGVIHITFPPNGTGSAVIKGAGGPDNPCSSYLTAASTALRGGKPIQKPSPAKLEQYAKCMRAHGIADFPDPTGNGLRLSVHPGSDLDPNNPTFQSAAKLCAKKTGVAGFGGGSPPRGAIEASSSGGPGAGRAGNSNRGGFAIVTGGGGG